MYEISCAASKIKTYSYSGDIRMIAIIDKLFVAKRQVVTFVGIEAYNATQENLLLNNLKETKRCTITSFLYYTHISLSHH